MPHRRRTHRMVIKRDDLDVANRSGSVMKTDSDEVIISSLKKGCYSSEGGPVNGNDADEEVSSFFANQILGNISRLLSASNQTDGKNSVAALDNSSESDEMPNLFENIFSEHAESPFNDSGTLNLDEPRAKKARDDLGNARGLDDWPMKESGSSMTIPMPMCIRLVELYRRCRSFLRTFSQKKEDRKARHQMWVAIDSRLNAEFGINSGVNRLKKKIQNIQAGARGKIEALRRETSNGIIPQDTNIRFTPAEMEMVRMLYQNGDKVLNTVNENNEPFYMQLEALMRRESSEKKLQLHENGHAEKSPPTATAKPLVYPQMLINHAAQNGLANKRHLPHVTKEPPAPSLFNNVSCVAEPKNASIVSLFSKPFDVLSAAAHFPKADPVASSNGGHELVVMSELIARQMNIIKRQEELQRRAELLYEQQMARETKIVDSIASLNKAASHLEQVGEFLLNTCRYASVNGGTFSPNNS